MPICKTCGNDEWFFGKGLVQVKALVQMDEQSSVVEHKFMAISHWYSPVLADTCAKCKSSELDFPEDDLPF